MSCIDKRETCQLMSPEHWGRKGEGVNQVWEREPSLRRISPAERSR